MFPSIAETFYHIFRGKQIWIKPALPDLVVNESIIKFDDIEKAKNSMIELHSIMIDAIQQHYEELGEVLYQIQKGSLLRMTLMTLSII